MIDNKKVLENTFPPPHESARIAVITALVGEVILVGLWLFGLFYGLAVIVYTFGLIGFVVYGTLVWRKQNQDDREWSKNRMFQLSTYPVHQADTETIASDEKRIIAKREETWWRQPGPGFVWTPETTPRGSKVWRRVLVEEDRSWCMGIRGFLREDRPDVYQVVCDWYEAVVCEDEAFRSYERSYQNLNEAERSVVHKATEVEFLQACCVALRPDTWRRKFDRRPSHYRVSLLRERLLKLQRTHEHLEKQWSDSGSDNLWRWRPRHLNIYMGEGFDLHVRHTQKYQFRKYLDGDDWKVPPDPKINGDPRLYATGYREAGPVWTHYDRDMAQHSIVLGASGYGKTRLIESPAIASIYNGSSVMNLDPKEDADWINLVAYHTFKCGREDDFLFFSVGSPDSPYNNTFNPLNGYIDPSEIGSRIGAFLPAEAGENQYFLDEAKKVGRIIGTVCHWINAFLAACSDGDIRCKRAPKLLCWLEYLDQQAAALDAGQDAILDHIDRHWEQFERFWPKLVREERDLVCEGDAEEAVQALYLDERYSAVHWLPSVRHINQYAYANRHLLVGWAFRLAWPHLFLQQANYSDEHWQEMLERNQVTGRDLEEGHKGLIDFWKQQRQHPLMAVGGEQLGVQAKRWRYALEVCIPHGNVPRMGHVIERLDQIIGEHIDQVMRQDDEYNKATANLSAPMSQLIAGEKGSLLCDPDPDITWERIHLEKKIVMMPLGSMKDPDGSKSVAKALTQSLLSYGGILQSKGGADMDLVFIGDEMASWANEDWAQITDKLRGTGVRTFTMTQSYAGMRHQIGNADLMKHIITNITNRYTCSSQSEEDAAAFCEQIEEVQIYQANRQVSESPAFGQSGNTHVQDWSTSESWSWSSVKSKLVDKDMVSRLPVGTFLRYCRGKVTIFQAPYVERAPFSYYDQVGLIRANEDHRGVSEGCQVDGIDYLGTSSPNAIEHNLDGWGSRKRATQTSHVEVIGNVARAESRGYFDPLAMDDDEEDDAEDGTFDIVDEEGSYQEFDHADYGGAMVANEGDFKEIDANGNFAIGAKKNGKMHGPWRYYDTAGVLLHVIEYEDGERHGKMTKFHIDGSVASEQLWEEDELVTTSTQGSA